LKRTSIPPFPQREDLRVPENFFRRSTPPFPLVLSFSSPYPFLPSFPPSPTSPILFPPLLPPPTFLPNVLTRITFSSVLPPPPSLLLPFHTSFCPSLLYSPHHLTLTPPSTLLQLPTPSPLTSQRCASPSLPLTLSLTFSSYCPFLTPFPPFSLHPFHPPFSLVVSPPQHLFFLCGSRPMFDSFSLT